MSNHLIQQFFDSPYRKWYLVGLNILASFLLLLPAFDRYSALSEEHGVALAELAEAETQIEKGRSVKATLVKLRESRPTVEGIDADAAIEIRKDVANLLQETGCRLIRINSTDRLTKSWKRGANPLIQETTSDTKDKIELKQSVLQVTAEGTLYSTMQLISKVRNIHPLAIPTKMMIRNQRDAEMLQLELHLTLFDFGPVLTAR